MPELTADDRIEARYTAYLVHQALLCGLTDPDEINDFTTQFADTLYGRRTLALITVEERYADLMEQVSWPVGKLLDWLTKRRRE